MTKSITYSYDITPNNKVNRTLLIDQINKSPIRVSLEDVQLAQETFTVSFKIDLMTADGIFNFNDVDVLVSILRNHSGKDISVPKDRQGIPQVVIEKPQSGVPFNIATHNLCDKTTWFYNAVYNQDIALSSSDDQVFTSGIQNWIDLSNGKMLREERYSQFWGAPVINDGVEIAIRNLDTQGDAIIDYKNGVVTLDEPTDDEVMASFWSATTSEFYIKPQAGKRLRIEGGEMQFSQDVIMNDTIVVEFFKNFDGTTGELINNTYLEYKTAAQMIDESRGSNPVISNFGGTERGLQANILTLPLQFLQAIILDSATNDCIRVRLKNHQVFGGERATTTFYCTEPDN